jgi:hypothetical protein
MQPTRADKTGDTGSNDGDVGLSGVHGRRWRVCRPWRNETTKVLELLANDEIRMSKPE